MIDITESKRAQDKLLATQTELARVTSLTAAGQMAASMAHEIKQPLAAIVTGGSAGLRWLSKPTPDLEEVRALLESIVIEGNRASQVIDGIRAMFKNDSREKALLDVNEVIREVIALLHSELQDHQILVQAELTSELPPVLADRVQLQEVVANLVANAIEAMDTVTDRARTLRVRSVIDESDGVLIMVEDSGPGIDPENVDRIFHPFFTTKSQGTGMGLSICRSIIEAHNGRLSLRSASDRGSIFQISLPAGDFEAIALA
jgi:C4-dicarboxylate-specific signal transduction histidine kinase